MSNKLFTTLGSSLLALALFAGVADAAKGGSFGGGSPSFKPAPAPSAERRVDIKREVKPQAPIKIAPVQRDTVLSKSKAEPKLDPRVTTRVEDLKPKQKPDPRVTTKPDDLKPKKVDAKPDPRVTTKAENLKPSQQKVLVAKVDKSATAGKVLASTAAAGLGTGAIHNVLVRNPHLPIAPQADKQNRISQKSMDHFVASHVIQRDAKVLTKSDGAKYQTAVTHAQTLIKDPAKGYQVAKYGDTKKPAGDNSTIVINENNKTVYVPASSVSGPDRRTIVVNCNNCKVVIVGANGQNVIDEKKIIVNGNNDKVVLQSNKAEGGPGTNGGTVVDNRQVIVNGNGDKIKLQGNEADGSNGQRNQANGQNGGAGGYVDDNRKVTVNGNETKVNFGKDSANGGDGGRGSARGGDGGNGGKVDDDRTVVNNGNGTKVSTGGADANGGNGGNGGTSGGNGGTGGDISVKGGVTDNGQGTVVKPGDYNANGGNGGSGHKS